MLSRGVRGGGLCGGRGGFADSQTISISNPDQGFLVNDRQEQPIIGRGGARGGRGTFGSGSITDFNNSAMNAQEERTFGGRGGFCGGRGDSQTIPTSNPDQGSLANDRQEQPIIGRGGARGGRGSLGSVSSATNLQQQPHSTRGRGEGLFGQASSRGRFASGGNSTPLSESVSKERQHNDENKTKNDFDRQEQPRSNVSNEEAGKERPLLRYRPVDKPIEDIFAEDYECKEKYIDVTDNDDKVEITGVENMMEMKFEKWEELNLHPQLHQNIKKSEYVRPRKIQSHVIPYIISGYDLKVHSETGSGKTAAFAIPIIQKILSTPDCNRAVAFPAPFAVIIEPTRELCRQVYDQFRKFANDTFIKVCKTYGETSMNASIMEIKRGCDILICTPGRIKHFIKAEFVDVSKMMFFVLDEVDHMLKNNFLEDIRALFEFSSFPPKNSRQSLLFSATFPPEIQHLATEMLREKFVFASNKKPISPNSKIEQSFFQVQSNQKKDFLLELLGKELSTSEDKKNGKLRRALVFVETRRDSDVVSHYLVMNGIKSLSLNGNRSQPEREEALKKFDKGDIDVLVATDVCARGIDIKNLDHVINFDLPKDAVTYVHRIGRTGRLNTGYATNFVDKEMDSALIPSLVELLQNSSNQIPEFMLQSPDSKGNNSNSNVNYWSGVKSSNNKEEDTNWNTNDNYWGGVKSSNNKGEDTNWNTNDNYWGGVKSSNNKGEDTNLNSNDNCWSGVKSSDNNGEDTNWNSDDNYWNNGDVNDSWK